MFITRFLSGLVLLALSIVVVITGGYALGAFTLVLSVLAYFEMARALKIHEKRTLMIIGYIGIAACYGVMMFVGSGVFMIMCAVVTIIAFLVAYVVTFPKYTDIDTMSAIFSFVYAPLMLSFLPLTRALPEGKYIVWMIYISSWGSDTCAYCVGMITGKTVGNHTIFPKLSPKKSLEGIIGGVVVAAVGGEDAESTAPEEAPSATRGPKAIFWQAYRRLLGSVGKPLAVGLAISALVTVLVPDNFFVVYS